MRSPCHCGNRLLTPPQRSALSGTSACRAASYRAAGAEGRIGTRIGQPTLPAPPAPPLLQFDVTFPRMPCAWLGVDAMDISGEVQLEVDHDVYKRRLSSEGTPLDDGEPARLPGPAGRPARQAACPAGGG